MWYILGVLVWLCGWFWPIDFWVRLEALLGIGLTATIIASFIIWIGALLKKARWQNEKATSGAKKAIVAFSYRPQKNGNEVSIPFRGKLVVEAALKHAEAMNSPLLLCAGDTIQGHPHTEGKTYQIHLEQNFMLGVEVRTGTDRSVNNTWDEAAHALQMCRELGVTSIDWFSLDSHATRVGVILRELVKESDLKIRICPVEGPTRYIPWEAVMLCAHYIAKPDSKLKKFWIRNLAGRRA